MRRGGERYRNPCLTMHQPWASLLVHGIKRVEGRSWPSPITGGLWIHAASKVPDPDTIAAMEDFYREIYAVDGIADISFPDHYPVSRLLGCVEVVGCVRSQELACWEPVPQSVRLEALTDFCWLCENPQKLVVPFEMRGYQGVYNLERRISEAALRGLSPVQGPLPVKFPLPDPTDPFSLRPGSLHPHASSSGPEKNPSVAAAIAGARAAATQYSRKDHNVTTTSIQTREKSKGCSSGDAGLSSSAQNRSSHLQNQDHLSFRGHNSPSYLQHQDHPPSFMHNTRPLLQNQHLPSILHDYPSHSQNHHLLSILHDNPSRSQNHRFPSIVHDNPSHLQNQNPPYISQNNPSHMQHHNPPSIVHDINSPSYAQYRNTEPRRSTRLQNGASIRLAAVALRELKQLSVSERDQSVPSRCPR